MQRQEHGGWLDAVIEYHCSGSYGKANGLTGFAGYIAALEQLGLPYLVLTDIHRDYTAAYAQMIQLLEKGE